jgi:ribosomal protein S6
LNVRRWLLYRIKQEMDGIYQAFTIHVDGYMAEILWDYCSSSNVLERFKNLHEKRVILTFQK